MHQLRLFQSIVGSPGNDKQLPANANQVPGRMNPNDGWITFLAQLTRTRKNDQAEVGSSRERGVDPSATLGFDSAWEVWRRVSAMARRCGTWLVVLALVLTTGGHWAVLQLSAWAGMLVRYSQQGPVGEAISKTFDGQHPCRLCQLVRQGRAEEHSKESAVVVLKLDGLAPVVGESLFIPRPTGRAVGFPFAMMAPRRPDSPPVPPPRAV